MIQPQLHYDQHQKITLISYQSNMIKDHKHQNKNQNKNKNQNQQDQVSRLLTLLEDK